MGTWGHDAFGNDDALDWLGELLEAADLGPVEDSLAVTASAQTYLDAPDCSEALAAAEVVAALRGKPGSGLPKKLLAWLEGRPKPSPELLETARRAVAKVMQDSELKDLWVESGHPQAWEKGVQDLQSRLS